MKLLLKLILSSACCWTTFVQAFVPCTTSPCGGHTGPPPPPPRLTTCPTISAAGGVCMFDGVTGAVLPQTLIPPTGPFIVPTFTTGNCDWGSTGSDVDVNFARCILFNFITNPNLDTVVLNMPPLVLARFSDEMRKYDAAGYTQEALNAGAARLSAQSLALLAASFGPGPLAQAVIMRQLRSRQLITRLVSRQTLARLTGRV